MQGSKVNLPLALVAHLRINIDFLFKTLVYTYFLLSSAETIFCAKFLMNFICYFESEFPKAFPTLAIAGNVLEPELSQLFARLARSGNAHA